jgi:hypothetical protein
MPGAWAQPVTRSEPRCGGMDRVGAAPQPLMSMALVTATHDRSLPRRAGRVSEMDRLDRVDGPSAARDSRTGHPADDRLRATDFRGPPATIRLCPDARCCLSRSARLAGRCRQLLRQRFKPLYLFSVSRSNRVEHRLGLARVQLRRTYDAGTTAKSALAALIESGRAHRIEPSPKWRVGRSRSKSCA